MTCLVIYLELLREFEMENETGLLKGDGTVNVMEIESEIEMGKRMALMSMDFCSAVMSMETRTVTYLVLKSRGCLSA